ncbi:MAG: class I SAM-dependent methyltransferase [Ignavibacteriae bacterium]|nr:class I SAM-dependent methyltransferase [Ignavibacteriota bacterium]
MSRNNVHEKMKESYNALQTYKSSKSTEEYYKLKSKNKLRDYEQYLPKSKSAKIADLACGQGIFCYALKNEGYTNFIGVDNSKDQLELYKKFIGNTAFQADIFEFLKDKQEEFDVICLFDVIEHMERIDAIEFIKLVYNSLKPGGVFLLKTPNMNSPNCNMYSDITHIWGYNEFSLKAMLMTSSFSSIKIKPSKPRFLINYLTQSLIRLIFFFIDLSYERKDRNKIFTSNLVGVAIK